MICWIKCINKFHDYKFIDSFISLQQYEIIDDPSIDRFSLQCVCLSVGVSWVSVSCLNSLFVWLTTYLLIYLCVRVCVRVRVCVGVSLCVCMCAFVCVFCVSLSLCVHRSGGLSVYMHTCLSMVYKESIAAYSHHRVHDFGGRALTARMSFSPKSFKYVV